MAGAALFGEGLPSDRVVLDFEATEGLDELFAVRVRFATEERSFVAEDLLRHRLALQTVDARGRRRVFDGVVERAAFVDARAERLVFELELAPRLASLGHRQGCRIFQDLSIVDVVKQVLADGGLDDKVLWRLSKTYEKRPFTCQYRETELAFVRRLLEDEGIHFFFLHDDDGHTLVFADHPGGFGPEDGSDPVALSALQGAQASDAVHGLRRKLALRTTSVLLRDYDLEKPAVLPEADAAANGPYPLPVYEYPGGFVDGAAGKRKAQARLDADRRDADVLRGSTAAAGLCPGLLVEITSAPDALLEGRFVVTRLATKGASGEDVAAGFEAVPEKAATAPERRTPRPRILGVQSARITGPSHEAEGIHVDALGRVKVRFLWDRAGKNDDTTSCWLRVSQMMLGSSMVHPRVDWEVAVAFLQGDPDRPYVVGRVYDEEHKPPVALPAGAADLAIQSASSPGGAGMNGFQLGDGAGSQGFSMNAQKDMNTTVGDSRKETIGGNEELSVAANASVTIKSNDTVTVGGSQTIGVGDALQVKVGGAQTITVGGGETVGTVADMNEKGSTRAESIGGTRLTISNGVRIGVAGDLSRTVSSCQVLLSAAGVVHDYASTLDESAGAVIVHLVGGTHAETVGGAKTLTSKAAELHLVGGGYSQSAASVTQLVGGARARIVGGDVTITGSTILLGGGKGDFIAGGSSIKLNGGPVVVKSSAISFSGPVGKLGASLKMG